MIARSGKITEWSDFKGLGRVQVGDGRTHVFGLTTYYPGRNAHTTPHVGETVFVLCPYVGHPLRVEALPEERMRKEGKE